MHPVCSRHLQTEPLHAGELREGVLLFINLSKGKKRA